MAPFRPVNIDPAVRDAVHAVRANSVKLDGAIGRVVSSAGLVADARLHARQIRESLTLIESWLEAKAFEIT